MAWAEYSDHRGHNLDSLERVVAKWTIDKEDAASDEEVASLAACYDELMNGYKQINGIRSIYYAQKDLRIGNARGWDNNIWSASKVMGEHMWAQEKYDSAAFWYKNGLAAIQRMEAGSTSFLNPNGYSQLVIDNGYSAVYGSLGNLYCIQDSIPQALYYYGKAGEIFEKYGWTQSLAILNYNMGQLYLWQEDYKQSKAYYLKAKELGIEANDSLWIATPLKGLGDMYLQQGKTLKAMECLIEADKYFSQHEDQEFMNRIEILEMLNQVYDAQKKHMTGLAVAFVIAFLILLLFAASAFVIIRMRKEKQETAQVFEETIEELPKARKDEDIKLTDRELQILKLIEAGKTNPQIAEAIFLSPETIKWYRRKLLAKFDAVNSVELIAKARTYLE